MIASSSVEKPRAKESTKNSKRKKSKENNPRNITNLKSRGAPPIEPLPSSPNGVNTQRTPRANTKKLTATNTPPRKKARGSKRLKGIRLANKTPRRITCHSSIRYTLRIISRCRSAGPSGLAARRRQQKRQRLK